MTTKLFDTVFSLQSLVLGAAVESFGIIKLLPDHVPQDNPFIQVLSITVLVNVAFYYTFWGLVYPYLLSPIRHLPTINVSPSPFVQRIDQKSAGTSRAMVIYKWCNQATSWPTFPDLG